MSSDYSHLINLQHEFLLDNSAIIKSNEIAIDNSWSCNLYGDTTIDAAMNDLKSFLQDSLNVKLLNESKKQIKVEFNKDNSIRGYSIDIQADTITVNGSDVFAISNGLFHLQSIFKLRRAPFIEIGTIVSSGLKEAVVHSALKSWQVDSIDYPEAYNKEYLLKISRANFTAIHINLKMSMFFNSKILPELNNPQALNNYNSLQQTLDCCKECGLKVYLSLYLEGLDSEHLLFKRLPETKGSKLLHAKNKYVLCLNSLPVKEFLKEEFTNLFTQTTDLKGVILIAGGEGFLHCFTAFEPDENGNVCCNNCSNTIPEENVANIFNLIAKTIKATSPQANCVVWTYGLQAWSNINGEKFASLLSNDCELMTNFDTGEDYKIEGAKGSRFDYSLSCVGPARPYKKQSAIRINQKGNFWAKCENASPLEYASIQYVPAMTRWNEKFTNILNSKATGTLFNWKFIGYTEAMSSELAGLIARGESNSLIKLAIRDFGLNNLDLVYQGWQHLNKAIDYHPFSIGTTGYFKGPFYIGFTQPLFITSQVPYDLPKEFYWNSNKLMVSTDLSFVQPFGLKSCLKALKKLSKHWENGRLIIDALNIEGKDSYQTQKILQHQAMVQIVECMQKTALNMVKFYKIRESFNTKPFSPKIAEKKLLKMMKIAKDELINCKVGYELIKKYPQFIFSYTYRYGISPTMCQYKINHTENLINKELPLQLYSIRFSRGKNPRLFDNAIEK